MAGGSAMIGQLGGAGIGPGLGDGKGQLRNSSDYCGLAHDCPAQDHFDSRGAGSVMESHSRLGGWRELNSEFWCFE